MPGGDFSDIVSEGAKVEAWRLARALNLGLGVNDAERFASSGGCLHELERLITAGCVPAMAVEILT